MTIIEQAYAATVLWWYGLDKFPITSGVTAVFVAYLRMRNKGKALWSRGITWI